MEHPEGSTWPSTPWPSPGADLVGEGDDWWLTACMDWPRDRWIGYTGGYRRAAGLIVIRVATTGREQDYLVYPFLMCWRQYTELQLKCLIALLQTYQRESAEFMKTHRLDLLWQKTSMGLRAVFPDESEDLANAEQILNQLQAFDPTSEHFRYPVTSKGADTLAALPRVHMLHFHEVVEGLANLLEAADTAVREAINSRDEHEAAMDDWAGSFNA